MRAYIPIASLLLFSYSLFGQEEKIITEARAMIRQGNCDAAIIKLSGVPEDMQGTPAFLKAMGLGHDCKNHTDEAISYYRKYLEKASDDSVKKRYDELVSKRKSDEKSASVNDTYRQMSGMKKKSKHPSQGNGYFVGFAFGVSVPLQSGPFGYGLKYGADFGMPVKPKKITCVFDISAVTYSETRKQWMSRVLYTLPYEDRDMKTNWGIDASVTVPYWFVNNHDVSFGVGPVVGYRYVNMATPGVYPRDTVKFPNLGGPMFGATAVLNWGYQSFYLGYEFFQEQKKPLVPGGPDFVAKISGITIKVSSRLWRW